MIANGTKYDEAAYQLAHERMRSAPTTLTDGDFAQLEAVDPALVTLAHQLRRSAQPSGPTGQTKSLNSPSVLEPRSRLKQHFDAYTDALFAEVLKPIVAKQKALVEALEQRVRELEAKPQLKHCGPWIEGQSYSEGNFVTRKGGMWLAMRPQPDTPGAPNSGWLLVVKEGKA